MNRYTVVGLVVLVATVAFSADNQWDGNNFSYDGAFGLADKSSPDWSTATEISTIRTPLDSDTPSGPLGYLSLLNAENTTVNINHSFNGFLYMSNFGGSPPFGTPAVVTNRIVSVDQGVTITGALSDNTGGATADPYVAVQIVSPNDDLIILEEGKYVGGTGRQGVLMTGSPFATMGTLQVQGANILGSDGESYDAEGEGNLSFGSVGLQQTSGFLIIDSQQRETDAIRGGNGGNDMFGIAVGAADAYGGIGVSRFLFNNDMRMEDGYIFGGNGGTVNKSGSLELNIYGGTGLGNGKGAATLNGGVIAGGKGGTADVSDITDSSSAGGGAGVSLSATATDSFIGAVTIVGGAGGAITSTGSANLLDISGGNGLVINGSTAAFTNSGAQITGGAGGTLGSVGSQGVDAGGGEALLFSGSGAGGKVVLLGGNYTGGIGGAVTDETGTADVSGGRGLFITNGVTAEISGDAVIAGGASGFLNGIQGEQAVALEVRDANVIITNGTFVGHKGLLTTTAGGANTVEIHSGSFGDVEFSGNDENLKLVGGTYNEILLSGAGVQQLELGDVAVINDRLVLSSGQVDMTSWTSDHLNGALISNGTLNAMNVDFNMDSGASLTLVEETASISFGRDASVSGALSLGLGSFNVTSNFTAKSGAQLTSDVMTDGAGGNKVGAISGQDLIFENGVAWGLTFDGAISSNENLLANGIELAVASGSLSNDMNVADVKILANNPNWLKGISALTNVNETLVAVYDNISLETLFEDYDPVLQVAMRELYMTVENDEGLADYIAENWINIEDAAGDFEQGFVRTPEMASAMMGLQGVFADQIKDRTRSNLRFKKFGSRTAYSPSGSRGPSDWYDNSVQWTKDHMPRWDAKEAQRKASDNVPMPNIEGDPSEVGKAYNSGTVGKGNDYKAVQDALRSRTPVASGDDIEVPETYQVWGRGYGSHINQDSTVGFAGYDASIGGGVVGMDKRFENMLIGVGLGYAHTRVRGNTGNDGDADTVHAVGYFSHSTENLYFDASLNYAFNDISTEGINAFGYEADYNASTLGFAVGTGYGISFGRDKWLFTPEASYLGSLYSRGSYTEKSSLDTPFPDKKYDSYDEWSHQTAIGATLSMIGVIESFKTELEYQPEFRAHWLHEFNADLDNDAYIMAGGSGDSIAVALQAREEDLIRLGMGIRFSEWQNDTTEFGLDVDGAFGEDYHNIILSGKFMHRF
ncbi:autotransporter domain-containing protein [Pontiellaceae bacterium B12227]|nr:autotransporter domain-containing protein [Pontiellaceae bacterium B12227]